MIAALKHARGSVSGPVPWGEVGLRVPGSLRGWADGVVAAWSETGAPASTLKHRWKKKLVSELFERGERDIDHMTL